MKSSLILQAFLAKEFLVLCFLAVPVGAECNGHTPPKEIGQKMLVNLLLRNYLHHNLYERAEKLRFKEHWPQSHSNQQVGGSPSQVNSGCFTAVPHLRCLGCQSFHLHNNELSTMQCAVRHLAVLSPSQDAVVLHCSCTTLHCVPDWRWPTDSYAWRNPWPLFVSLLSLNALSVVRFSHMLLCWHIFPRLCKWNVSLWRFMYGMSMYV